MAPASSNPPVVLGPTTTNFSSLANSPNFFGTAPYNPFTFSFQDALRPLVGSTYSGSYRSLSEELLDESAYLFTNTCPQEGTQNCTLTCIDKDQAFSNLTTIHNCASYPMIALLSEEGNISATASDGTSIESLGFQKSKQGSSLLSNITTTLTQCLNSTCTTLECQEELKNSLTTTVFNSSDAFFNFLPNATGDFGEYRGYQSQFAFADVICELQSAKLNPDVGGIGVFVSYWIQSGLAILGSLFITWWGWGVYYCCFITHSLRYGQRAGREYAKKIGAKYRNSRLPSVTAALAEFQKAQCFFMLAINIAAQVNRGRGGFQPTNLQELYDNYALIGAISVSGYLPITLTLLTLHTVGMVSWYLIILSALTVALSIATSIDIGTFEPTPRDMDYLAEQFEKGGTAECGNKNLLVYCLTSQSDGLGGSFPYYNSYSVTSNSSSGDYSTMAFCLVVLVLLILDQTGVIGKLRNIRAQASHSKSQKFFIKNFMNIRGLQLLLAALTWVPMKLSPISSLFSVLFLTCLFYIFLTSNLRYEPRKTWTGKLFSKWIVLAADAASWILALAYVPGVLYYSAAYVDENSSLTSMSVALSVLLCITFTLTVILTSIHIHATCTSKPKKNRSPSQYSTSRRRLASRLSPIRQFIQPIDSFFRSEAIVSRIKRFKRDMNAVISADDLNTRILDVFICLLYIMFHGFYLFWFVNYSFYLGSFFKYVDKGTWSFGQIVAITVWAQPLFEYFHLEIRGMTRGFQHRLMWPYKVVRQDEDAEKGQQRRPSSDPLLPIAATDNRDTPKRDSYDLPTRASSVAEPTAARSADENAAVVGEWSLSMTPANVRSLDGMEAGSMMDQSRYDEDDHHAAGSRFSWQHEEEQEQEQEHLASRRSYLRIPERDGLDSDLVQEQEQEQAHEPERDQNQEHEPYWQIPESALLRPNDLRFE